MAHLRTEAYPVYRGSPYPPEGVGDPNRLPFEANNERIDEAKRRLGAEPGTSRLRSSS